MRRTRKRKTAQYSAEKRILSETEHDHIVGIPLIVRPCPVVVEVHTVIVVVEVEHVRIAVRVGLSRDTPSVTLPTQDSAGLNSVRDRKSPEAYSAK
jgi:hypothetical protein